MSKRHYKLTAALLVAVLGATGLQSLAEEDPPEPLETDWLELVKGYRGGAVGAELREIEEQQDSGMRKVVIAIPRTAIEHPDAIEEVVVVGKKPQQREPLDISYEWLDNYDKDNYGLVIRLSKDTRWPIRLYMRSDEGFVPRTITTLE
jgi:hypothetical protein